MNENQPATSDVFTRLSPLPPAELLEELAKVYLEKKEYHRLFDLRLLRKKFELGLPLHRPTSFDDVPKDKRDAFEESYTGAAREAGQHLIAVGKLTEAWMYWNAIRETEPVRSALEALPLPREGTNETEALVDLALYKGAHPVKGLQIMLKTHGICSSITALDQIFNRLPTEERSKCAAVMVQHLHGELSANIDRDIRQRLPMAPLGTNLREKLAGREWLFEAGNYHVDVSHLNAVVRFGRSLGDGSTELAMVADLAEYGRHLAVQYQYEGDPPFEDFYPAHIHFFNVLLGRNLDEGLAYFRQKLEQEPDAPDQALIAFVLVDLLVRRKIFAEAILLARKYLVPADEEFMSGLIELCTEAGDWDSLKATAVERNDLFHYATAILSATRQTG